MLCRNKYLLMQYLDDRKTNRLQQDKGRILLVLRVGFAMLSAPWMARKETCSRRMK
jgi:hypothetical protein